MYIYIHIYIYIYIYIYICKNIYIYIYINSLSAGQTSGSIHSFNATDLFRMAKGGHTRQAI